MDDSSVGQQCMACRVTGTLTSIGIAGYCLYEKGKLPTDLPALTIKSRVRMLNGLAISIGLFRALKE